MTLGRRNRMVLLLVGALSPVMAAALALAVTHTAPFDRSVSSGVKASTPGGPDDTGLGARGFLNRYVTQDGRTIRRDQGGDTVSEGQAYAMLIALGSDDEEAFGRVWGWTSTRLKRPDGLLSWRWSHGSVQDPSSAADADLDTARALVLAGDRFERPSWTASGVRLGRAILDHETAPTPSGRVLLAGSWATHSPHAFNPSYVSPVATQVLGKASGDPRWAGLEKGSREALKEVAPKGHLPPDWAQISPDGTVEPMPGPSGHPVEFGYDAARVIVRNAESCSSADRDLAAEKASLLNGSSTVAVYDLGGSPQTNVISPLTLVAASSGIAADGAHDAARKVLASAESARRASPTYYGDAWTVLGRMLLTDDHLGGCPALEGK